MSTEPPKSGKDKGHIDGRGKFWFNNLSIDQSITIYLECEECREELYCRPPIEEDWNQILLIRPHKCEGT